MPDTPDSADKAAKALRKAGLLAVTGKSTDQDRWVEEESARIIRETTRCDSLLAQREAVIGPLREITVGMTREQAESGETFDWPGWHKRALAALSLCPEEPT